MEPFVAVPGPGRPCLARLLWALAVLLPTVPAVAAPPTNPFAGFDLPGEWKTRYWASPDAQALFALEPEAVAALVPVQAGVHFCRCPACDAPEADDPLTWSPATPKVLTCRRCAVVVPNDKFPAKDEKKGVPEETVEVLPGVTHTYPYHQVEPAHQRHPDERLYLDARRDDAAREFLARSALYAALRHRTHPDPALARTAAVIVLRCAQVYPAYATHYDQPSAPKFFGRADLPPPYRQGYATGKWCASGSQDVPLNLLVAYALLRDDPALAAAGDLLNVRDPARRIQDDLFRASARFVAGQPEGSGVPALQAIRGVLAVGRLLDDAALVRAALARLDRFSARGFAYDGFCTEGTLTAQRRLLGQLDGWFDPLPPGPASPPAPASVRGPIGPVNPAVLSLARAAAAVPLADPRPEPVRLASWPAPVAPLAPRGPALLGGTGLARLAVGDGDDALDVELRGLDAGPDRICRQALRLAVGGRTVLDDLDETAGTPTGFDRASVSRNTVVVDGLNQRESPARAASAVPSGNIVFFGADPDFQVVALDDPRAYPESTSLYRQTVIASAGRTGRYAVGVFEVRGGLRHDQLFHGAAGSSTRWALSERTERGPETLLPPGLPFLSTARAEDRRWFIQSYGEVRPVAAAALDRPTRAWLTRTAAGPGSGTVPWGVRLHVLGDGPLTAVTAVSPDPTAPTEGSEGGRGTLVLRHRSRDGSTLRTTFVTVFEPVGGAIPPLRRVGRVGQGERDGEAVVVAVETADGPEHLVVNLQPGRTVRARLADGRVVATDGLAVRVTAAGMVLAGGTFADAPGRSARQRVAAGRIRGGFRAREGDSPGGFESDTPLPDAAALAGRILLVRHGDGTTRGWTLRRVENTATGARLLVREDPGFHVDPAGGAALYDRGPTPVFPGPHEFRVSRLTRAVDLRP